MDIKKAQELLAKQQQGTLTPKEQAILDSWYIQMAKSESDVPLTDLAKKQQAVFSRINQTINEGKITRLWPRLAVAASILLICSAGIWFALGPHPPTQQTAQLLKNDIAPGHNQATLVLANGKRIILTKGLNGLLATQGKTTIQATGNDIAYHTSQNDDQVNSYNTMTTARGEQSPYPLVLADGTKVWLNAQSSITFPTVFNGKERMVKLSGEAYFEVKHNAAQPFKVQTANQTIEDIGTAFDVNAYSDEPKQVTTLLQGSIKVNNRVLLPGQQTDGATVKFVNTDNTVAWKNGEFRFDGEKIDAIMRQLSRWYAIDVRYEGILPQEIFYGKISRYKNISQALNMLAYAGSVRFKIEGRRVTVIR